MLWIQVISWDFPLDWIIESLKCVVIKVYFFPEKVSLVGFQERVSFGFRRKNQMPLCGGPVNIEELKDETLIKQYLI